MSVHGQSRTVLLPGPSSSRKLEVRGPTRRACRTAAEARRRFEDTLAEAAQEDKDAHGGWSLWWGDRPHIEEVVIVVWLWPEDSEGGDRSATLLREVFEAADFQVKRADRSTRPPTLHTRPFVVRVEDALAGSMLFPGLTYTRERGRTAPEIVRRFDFPVQECPACRTTVQPRRALWGMPSAAMRLRLSLGEVVAMGCAPGPGEAVCPACWAAFAPRRQ